MYKCDKRIVMTLDAGGTNFVFSAIQGNREMVTPVCLPAETDNLELCFRALVSGFEQVKGQLSQEPVAISFAFPGPADYEHGVIGDLPNFPAFRGGVALGRFLEKAFGIPVFINNDGNLFAYGEALAGILPELNQKLKEAGNERQFRNLIGITLGTGFGAGIVINRTLLTGDNGCGGDLWNFRNLHYPGMIAEESVSIRAVNRVYAELSGDTDAALTPKDICDIADGRKAGDCKAAKDSFRTLGHALGDAIASALTLIDGVVVIGGGLSGASAHILPAVMEKLNERFTTFSGNSFDRLQMKVLDVDQEEQLKELLTLDVDKIPVCGTKEYASYVKTKKTGIAISRLGTNHAVCLGAYAFALNELDKDTCSQTFDCR